MRQPVSSLGAALVLFSLACGDPGFPDTQPPSIILVSPRDLGRVVDIIGVICALDLLAQGATPARRLPWL